MTAFTEVKYQTTENTDYDTNLTTLNASNWYTDTISQPARIAFRDYPHTYEYALNPVVVTFTAGYTVMPTPVLQAIRLVGSSHVREPPRGGYRHDHHTP